MKLKQIPCAMLLVFATSGSMFALPSLDPNQKTQLNLGGDAYTLTRDDKQLNKWYYTPSRVRIIEDEAGVPQVAVVTYVSGNTRHAIIQATVTCAAPEDHIKAMQKEAFNWYTPKNAGGDIPQTDQIKISPLGPLKLSKIKLLQIATNESGATITPLPDSSDSGQIVAPEKKVVAVDGKTVSIQPPSAQLSASNLVFPGAQDLTQQMVIQVEVSGIGVDLYENLIKGKTGGLAVYFDGTYDAISIPVKLSAKLDVNAVHEYFRQDTSRSSGWRFLCFGGSSSSVETYIRSNDVLNKALTFDGVKTEDISDAQWDAISSQLVRWVTGEIFTVSTQPSPTGGRQALELPNTTVDIGKFSPLFGLPYLGGMGLSVGYSRANGNFKFDLKQTYNATSTATWNQQVVKSMPLAVSGVLSLGGYKPEKIEGLVRNIQPVPLPRVFVRMPTFTDTRLTNAMFNSQVSVTVGGQAGRVWTYSVSGPNKEPAWIYGGNDAELGWSDSDRRTTYLNTLVATFNVGMDVASAKAKLSINRLNTHATSIPAAIGVPHPIEMTADADGNINFAGERFPFKVLNVDPSSLDFGANGISKMIVTFGTDGGGLTEKRDIESSPVVFPVFDQAATSSQGLLYAGQITAMRANVKYTDALRGGALNATWVASQVLLSQIEASGGYVSLTPTDFGITNYTVDVNWLFEDRNDVRGIELTFSGPGPESFAQLVKRDSAAKRISFVTNQMIRSGQTKIYFSNGTEREIAMTEEQLSALTKSRNLSLTGSFLK